ncbi:MULTISPECIES: dihydroxyacetone kinase subunit DhaL [unclassified Aureimonas]|uniref:dihydroxyacetone kinase subunit DhaL n=1 Tax=unclassified Aureimonas TaxID=2615206 RepID=UPI0006F5C12B|nr:MULTISPECIES: dihydroxyacetone kinase subunit DhaL [unclassified Aureimonas]KQT63306.1 dihydroxyacetone kinase [Aureimonas sp. Leaf427]KQT80114.1 dihydroxyacetone kinase [Aureimonas sp. Leaf460]
MKKLINDPSRVVDEMIEGIVLSHEGLAVLSGHRVILRSDVEALRRSGKVAIVSGGGSGHEPAHAGYVGEGMLTAAVCGDVFTSPSTDAVLAAIRAVTGTGGTLLIVKNYTGDRLNFGLAAELARSEGLSVAMVVVADDVSLSAGGDNAGRRGIAGTVLVHKVAGAAAAAGRTLEEVEAEAERAAHAVGTMGVALTPCIVPAAGKPSFTLGEDEIELGLGIHGEAGVERVALRPVDDLVGLLVDRVLDSLGLREGETVALLANNLGGTPAMEMDLVARAALKAASARGTSVERMWTGTFLTAIEMAGCSISAMRLDPGLLSALDAPASAPAWPGTGTKPSAALPTIECPREEAVEQRMAAPNPRIVSAIRAAAERLVAEETRLTDLDRKVGDGDLGANLARGAQAILAEIDTYRDLTAAAVLRALSASLRRTVGGTSGALYAAGLLRAANTLEGRTAVRAQDWSEALRAGAQAIAQIGDAKVGDRTMLDALLPAADRFSGSDEASFFEAVEAARTGAEATAAILPRRGRSSYLGERALGIPDPGAEAAAAWLDAVAGSLGDPADPA